MTMEAKPAAPVCATCNGTGVDPEPVHSRYTTGGHDELPPCPVCGGSGEAIELCACGQPLHYSSLDDEAAVKAMIEVAGGDQYITIKVDGFGKYRVQRHYIALHGVTGIDVALDPRWERVG